jgi:dienelactone hydrolase
MTKTRRINGLSTALLTCLVIVVYCGTAPGQEKDFNAYSENVSKYLKRIYDKRQQPMAYREDYAGGFRKWQQDASEALRQKIGLQKIAASVGDHKPVVKLDDAEDLGQYWRQKGVIETEPDVKIPFWLLKPKGDGPWPLGVFPHGHDRVGHNTTAGVYTDDDHKRKSLAEDRDVAVQAVKLGFLAIAPSVRGLSTDGVPDLHDRHGKRACRSQAIHCLLAGRTATGERVWDMQRILDWAIKLHDVDSRRVLMMGNSGGGMVTLFTAACDERIGLAVPSCSFAPTISDSGYIFHCDCNMVPGLIELGGLTGVAGLIAPRHLLAVNGRTDSLFNEPVIERAVRETKMIYKAAGHAERFNHRWGAAGHRFYADLMWPFVADALND